jgi:hypothetical protein
MSLASHVNYDRRKNGNDDAAASSPQAAALRIAKPNPRMLI